MESRSPGVNVIEKKNTASDSTIESAVPLFIGFTQKKVSSVFSPIIKSLADYEVHYGGQHSGLGMLYKAIKHFFDNGGMHAYIFSLGCYDELDIMTSEEITAAIDTQQLSHLVQAEQSITLLAFPDCTLIPDGNITQWHKVWDRMLNLSQVRRALFAVLDSPRSPVNAVTCVHNYESDYSENAAVWWPHLITSYSDGASRTIIPPSGAVVAAIQKNDHERGVWSAPANIPLSKVIKPEYSWLDAHKLFSDRGSSLNVIRSFPGKGTRIWGSRTLTTDLGSQFQYIQTRRFINWVELNTSKICRMFLFEPNNEITWFKIKGIITNWLRKVWYQGGLYGIQEDEAFNILIGIDESMSERDVLEGKIIVKIRLSVLYPAEFIEVTLNLNVGNM
ncbi:phage tail sheath C-terminal domain-containing protein [Aeromonas sp. SG16]|uniref:phage tail sheath family protein n=1 Tax=Aeromonas sp. SG16 TaxID=2950548 RepID=UPI00210D9D87|nr:phage tail sheath C-terminal domain-containing protein [Aeromonas sp. SG16]MCQ4054438.1 hypothetical protein [Aeromonas sp. SG16]